MLLGFACLYFDVFASLLPHRFADLPEHKQTLAIWLVVGQSLLFALMWWLARHPQYCNQPVKVTDANRSALYQITRLLAVRLLLLTSLTSMSILIGTLAPFFSVELLTGLFCLGLLGAIAWICILHLRVALRL